MTSWEAKKRAKRTRAKYAIVACAWLVLTAGLVVLPLRLAFAALSSTQTAPEAALYADLAQAAALLMTSAATAGVAAWSVFRTEKMQREVEQERVRFERNTRERDRIEARLRDKLGSDWHLVLSKTSQHGEAKLEQVVKTCGLELGDVLPFFPNVRATLARRAEAEEMARWEALDPVGFREYQAAEAAALDDYMSDPDRGYQGDADADFVEAMREKHGPAPPKKRRRRESLPMIVASRRMEYR
ncbi:MAG: hypothetical protein QOE90_3316 [Thermoplasmata archaeon]|jgi:hypothetical protein|nr:hypothetical protein [Thermoplasmata archaeon]